MLKRLLNTKKRYETYSEEEIRVMEKALSYQYFQ